MSLNKVMLIGNVGADPEVRYLDGNGGVQGAVKVATIRLATTERYRDRNGETAENTEWHSVVAWRNSADLAEKFIHKGSQIYVEGRLRTRSWTDQQGVKKFTTEVVADTIQLLGRRSDNPAPAAQQTSAAPARAPQQPSYQQNYNQPAGFQPREAAQTPAQTTSAPLDIMADGADDLPF